MGEVWGCLFELVEVEVCFGECEVCVVLDVFVWVLCGLVGFCVEEVCLCEFLGVWDEFVPVLCLVVEVGVCEESVLVVLVCLLCVLVCLWVVFCVCVHDCHEWFESLFCGECELDVVGGDGVGGVWECWVFGVECAVVLLVCVDGS